MLTSRWSPLELPNPKLPTTLQLCLLLLLVVSTPFGFYSFPISSRKQNIRCQHFISRLGYITTLSPNFPRLLWYQRGRRGWYLAGFWKQLKSGAAQHQQRPPPYQVICQQAHKLLNKRAGFNNDSLLPIREIHSRILRSRWKIAFIHNNAFDHFGRWLQICQIKRLTVGHVTWTKNSLFHYPRSLFTTPCTGMSTLLTL